MSKKKYDKFIAENLENLFVDRQKAFKQKYGLYAYRETSIKEITKTPIIYMANLMSTTPSKVVAVAKSDSRRL
jgi:hypothetical protein